MKIIIIRHGQQKNGKLTRLGKKQAKLVCNDLVYENVGMIYSSPSQRAVDTAKIISKKLKLQNFCIDKRLDEREKPQNYDPNNNDYIKKYLNVTTDSVHPEGCKQFVKRVFEFLDEARKQNYESIVLVTHSSVAYAINAYFTGIPKDNTLIWMRLGNCAKLCYDTRQKD